MVSCRVSSYMLFTTSNTHFGSLINLKSCITCTLKDVTKQKKLSNIDYVIMMSYLFLLSLPVHLLYLVPD